MTDKKQGPSKRTLPLAAFYPMGETVFIVVSNQGLKAIKKGKTLEGTIAGNDKSLSMKILTDTSFDKIKANVINAIHKREIVDKKVDETSCDEPQA